jgi:hypothetical protein
MLLSPRARGAGRGSSACVVHHVPQIDHCSLTDLEKSLLGTVEIGHQDSRCVSWQSRRLAHWIQPSSTNLVLS